jgi:outer membrane cobalamin receptor
VANLSRIILILSLLSPVYGQTKLGRVVLTVVDESGAPVPGVVIQIQSGQTHVLQSSVTNGSGEAIFRGLPFGAYVALIDDSRFEPATQPLLVSTEVSQSLKVQLKIKRLSSEVAVSEPLPLVDPQKTNSSLYRGEEQIRKRFASLPNRDSINMVASLPGWVLESNGVLHPRGLEYQTQYVFDGVPIFDNRSPGFASAPLMDATDSLEVITGGIPAEFGRKLGGVINVTSRSATNQGRGEFELQGGSHSLLGAGLQLNGTLGKMGYSGVISASHTNRYLDPPSTENFHNQANLASGFLRLDYIPNVDNAFRIFAWANGTHLQVPNEPFQQQAGQEQSRENREQNLTISWERYYSSRATSSVSAYARHMASNLDSNPFSTPVISHQNREFETYGALGSFSWVYGNHQLKVGGDTILAPVRESFSFAVSDRTFFADESDEPEGEADNPVLAFTPDNPFHFYKRSNSFEYSFYLQDRWNWKNLTANLGLRYDGYHFLVQDQAWSPRVGLGYFVPLTRTNIHFAYDRAFQTPSIENLLLTSSPEAQTLSPVRSSAGKGSHPVPTSLAHFYEFGFSQALGRWIRLDGHVFRRDIRNFEDDDVFFNTGVTFPITLRRARIKGAELRVELQGWQGLSGFASYSNLLGYAFSPVTGGLFLGEEMRQLGSNVQLPISQDQRNTLNCQIYYQPKRSSWWVALGIRYESGLPVELDEVPESVLSNFFSRAILDQVNFSRGRIKPRHLWDVSSGLRLWKQEHRQAVLQMDLINITNRFYLINFDSLFSGTALGLPRTLAMKLSYQF